MHVVWEAALPKMLQRLFECDNELLWRIWGYSSLFHSAMGTKWEVSLLFCRSPERITLTQCLNHCSALVLHCPWFRDPVAHWLAGGNHEYFVSSVSVYSLVMIYCMVSCILYLWPMSTSNTPHIRSSSATDSSSSQQRTFWSSVYCLLYWYTSLDGPWNASAKASFPKHSITIHHIILPYSSVRLVTVTVNGMVNL